MGHQCSSAPPALLAGTRPSPHPLGALMEDKQSYHTEQLTQYLNSPFELFKLTHSPSTDKKTYIVVGP